MDTSTLHRHTSTIGVHADRWERYSVFARREARKWEREMGEQEQQARTQRGNPNAVNVDRTGLQLQLHYNARGSSTACSSAAPGLPTPDPSQPDKHGARWPASQIGGRQCLGGRGWPSLAPRDSIKRSNSPLGSKWETEKVPRRLLPPHMLHLAALHRYRRYLRCVRPSTPSRHRDRCYSRAGLLLLPATGISVV